MVVHLSRPKYDPLPIKLIFHHITAIQKKAPTQIQKYIPARKTSLKILIDENNVESKRDQILSNRISQKLS